MLVDLRMTDIAENSQKDHPKAKKEDLQERINQTCDEIFKEGGKPSVRLIHKMFPDVKSSSTIHNRFKVWQNQMNEKQSRLKNNVGLSDDFIQMFMNEISRFTLQGEAKYQLRAEQAENAYESSLDSLMELENTNQTLEGQLIDQQQLVRELKASIASLKQSHDAEIKELEANHAKDMDIAETKLNEKQGVIADLGIKLKTSDERNGHLYTEIAELKVSSERDKLEVEKAQEIAESAQQQLAQVKAENDNFKIAVGNKDFIIETHTKTIAKYESERDGLMNQFASQSNQLKEQNNEIVRINRANSDLENRLTDFAGLQENLNQSYGDNIKLTAQMKAMAETNQSLKDEVARYTELFHLNRSISATDESTSSKQEPKDVGGQTLDE